MTSHFPRAFHRSADTQLFRRQYSHFSPPLSFGSQGQHGTDTTRDQKAMDYTEKLSDDSLCYIFWYSITSTFVLPPIFGDSRLRLMAVSRRWRRIILRSTNFWDTTVIIPSSPVLTPGLAKIAEKWLKIHWKNDHILSVFLLQPRHLADVNRPGSREHNQIFRVVEDGILPAARSTKSFSCTLGTKEGIESFFAIPPGIFCCLEKLELSVPMLPDKELARHAIKTTIEQGLHRFTAFQRLPRLRSAVITIKIGINPLAFRIPWRQLTKLDMMNTTLSPHIFLQVISSPALSLKDGSFTIQFKRIIRSNSLASKNIFRIAKLRFLQNLRLRLIDPTLDTRIFSRIHLTTLCHLRIDLVQDLDKAGWTISIYQKLLSKSRDTMKSLMFWDAPFRGYENNEMGGPTLVYSPPCSRNDLDGLFSMLPKLEHLHLPIGIYIPQNAADKIARGILLPSLRILDVSSTFGVDILDIVERRNELAYYRAGCVGSSKLENGSARTDIYPPFFSHVLLLTSSNYRSQVELAKRYLHSSSNSQGTVLDIRYVGFPQ